MNTSIKYGNNERRTCGERRRNSDRRNLVRFESIGTDRRQLTRRK